MRLAAALLAVALAWPAAAQEPQRVPLRVGNHAEHGRLVFDWPARVGYSAEIVDERIVLRFDAPATLDLDAGRRPPRNVRAIAQEGAEVVIRVAPGARLRHFRLGNRVVLDVLDAALPQAAQAAPPAAVAARPQSTAPDAPLPAPPRPPPTEPQAASASVVAPTARPAPPPLEVEPAAPMASAVPVAPPAPASSVRSPPAAPVPRAGHPVAVRVLSDAPAISIPADAETGLAVFRRGEWIIAVLDRALPLDLAALRRHAVFGEMEVAADGEATVLRLRLAAPAAILARRDGAAWRIEAVRESGPSDAGFLRAVPDRGPPARLILQGGLVPGLAGRVVTIADPATGEPLLVATLRREGPHVGVARRLPQFEMLPTMLGAAVLARSDRIVLRVLSETMVVEAAGEGVLALGAAAGQEPPAEAVAMTRLLDLPVGPVPLLMERLRTQLLSVQDTPPLARGALRRDAAETLLALGMPQEAQAMTTLALREDPRVRDDARLILAQGAAAMLAGRLDEARGIDDPRLPSSDEVSLWRALRLAARGEEARAAPALAAGAALLLAYPEALRVRLLPPALEAMAVGGEAAVAERLAAEIGDEPRLVLARALMAEAAGRTDEALAGYGAVAAGRDRRQRGMALRRAAELRLATGRLDAAATADALEQSLFAWRGSAEEVLTRQRIAALRLQAGQGPAAFAMVEETGRLFPDQAAALRPALAEAFAAALETAPPLAAATLFDTHPGLLPGGARGEAAVLLLAERLAALDLPMRAAALLERAAAGAEPATRAAIGARLAGLRAAEGDVAAALAALDSTAAPDLPEPLATQRAVLRARALARQGQREEAQALLAGLGPAGAEARAELHAEARDWVAAGVAQQDHLTAMLPAAPAALDQAQRAAVARAAVYHALAGDEAALADLRQAHGTRMQGGPLAEAFTVLTSDPMRGVADLPRLQQEIGMLRLLPSRLEALRGPVPIAR